MAIRHGSNKGSLPVFVKIVLAGLVGLAVAGLAIKLGHWKLAPLLGWDSAALVYLVWTWRNIWPMDAAETSSHALREDPSRAASDIAMLVASVASLVAVGLILYESGQSKGALQILQVGLGFVSVVVSWAMVHTLFTLSYAEIYYGKPAGGIDFNESDEPEYKDFAYLAFTVGMTFQVSDTEITTKAIRQTVLKQAIIAYLFGTVIVASTINLIAGLSK